MSLTPLLQLTLLCVVTHEDGLAIPMPRQISAQRLHANAGRPLDGGTCGIGDAALAPIADHVWLAADG